MTEASRRPRISKETVLTISGHIIKIANLIPVCQTVAKVAEEILTLADTANRNQEVFKLLVERVEASSLWLIELSPPEKKCQLAYKQYVKALTEIRDYVNELSKPGKFSKRFLIKVSRFFTAKDIEVLHKIYKTKLDEAISEFSLALNYDCNFLLHKYTKSLSTMLSEQSFQLNEIQEKQSQTHTAIMLIQKGIEMPESELEKIRLSPERICSEDGEEPEMRGENGWIKRQLYGSQEVAVKKAKIPEGENRKSIDKYAFLMSKLSHCNNIEKFYGTLLINHELHIVTEWAEKGNLEDFLQSDQEILWLRRLEIAEQIANALEFIHRAEIYHHDVRSRNVLLDKYLDAKLTGFDYSRLQQQSTTSSGEQILSLRWTAPEKLKRESFAPYSKKCDIYGFSITLWEIGMRKKPFEEIEDDISVVDHVIKDGRPKPVPTEAPLEYIELMTQGWSGHVGTRPTIEVMREKLHKLVKQYRKHPNISLPASELQDNNSNNLASSMSQPIEIPAHSEDHSFPPFEDVLKLHKQKKYTSAFPLFQQYAALSNRQSPLAKYYCGYYLYYGKVGITKDEDSAIEYLRQAADLRIVKALALYAEACLMGSTYDPENGIKYLKKAVKYEDRSALEMWAEILYDGKHDQEINLNEAIKVWEKAANKGSEIAKEKLRMVKNQDE